MIVVYVPPPTYQHISFARVGLCCLLMDVSIGATLTAVPLMSAFPTYPKTLMYMSFKFLLKCHLLREAFAALLCATVLALPTPGTPYAPRELGCSLSPRDGALKVMSRSLDFVSKVVRVEARCILEESLWLSYGEDLG